MARTAIYGGKAEMKRTLLLVLSVSLLLAFSAFVESCAHSVEFVTPEPYPVFSDYQYTYDGEIDPAVLLGWNRIREEYEGEHYFAWWVNPDKNETIKNAVTIHDITEDNGYFLVGFKYWIEGTAYIFVLNERTNHFGFMDLGLEVDNTTNI